MTLTLWGTTLICGLVALAMPVLAGLMFRLKRSTATALHRHVANPRLKVFVPLVGVLTTARKGSALIVTVYVGLNVLLLAMWWKEKAVKATGMLAAVRSPKKIRGHRHAVDTPRIRHTPTLLTPNPTSHRLHTSQLNLALAALPVTKTSIWMHVIGCVLSPPSPLSGSTII